MAMERPGDEIEEITMIQEGNEIGDMYEKIRKMEKKKENMMKKIKVELCDAVTKHKWDEVVKICGDLREARFAWITSSNDTALHMAVYGNEVKIVQKLVCLMDRDRGAMRDIIDNGGYTPLHVAAKMGNIKICHCIASAWPHLIGRRNRDSETPLFLTALHGQKLAFLYLYRLAAEAGSKTVYEYGGRPSDGTTILHCAIDGEYFDLAYQIIRRVPEFVNRVDEQGRTPLHLLASKPSAFRKSCRLWWPHNIIYHCVPRPIVEDDHCSHAMERHFTCALSWSRHFTCDLSCSCKDFSENSRTTDEENPPWNAEQKKNSPFNYLKGLFMVVAKGVLRRIKDLILPKQILEMKRKHVWSSLVMKELLNEDAFKYEYEATGMKPATSHEEEFDSNFASPNFTTANKYLVISTSPNSSTAQEEFKNILSLLSEPSKLKKKETPMVIAAKNGVIEIVESALKLGFPLAVNTVDSEGKNMLLGAVESRQPRVFQLLLKEKHITDKLLRHADNDGNNVLHLAAKLETSRPWLAPNTVLQMQWEIKWFEFVKNEVPKFLLAHKNKAGMTPEEVFMNTHKELLKSDTEWLMKTSDSCTIVAALVATVAFATSSSVPGDFEKGEPFLKGHSMFKVFAVSSLVALCFSLTAVVMFLATLTSRHQAADFRNDLPIKLLVGLTALFISIVTMLVSFCGGHFFVLRGAVPETPSAPIATEYVLAFLPVVVFGIAQCPLYYKLLKTMLKKVPERGFIHTT